MELFPAVDIRDGRAVRLAQGDYEREQVYNEDPLAAAMQWVEGGARWLHVVDLDGARSGERHNIDQLRRITAQAGIPVQYGGGLRSIPAIENAIEAGAKRVILGTAAFQDRDFLLEAVQLFGDGVVVSVDSREGMVAAAGWTQETTIAAPDAVRAMADDGVRVFVHTDIDRDGMMGGPNLTSLAELCRVAPEARFIASGGVGDIDHIAAVADAPQANIEGVIVGKALYEQRFTVQEALAVLDTANAARS
jgi:phosphoribosylformimino-5-aminoimidazole carboxamide ribotide isomerase